MVLLRRRILDIAVGVALFIGAHILRVVRALAARAREHDYRRVGALLPQLLRCLVTVEQRHFYIHEHDIVLSAASVDKLHAVVKYVDRMLLADLAEIRFYARTQTLYLFVLIFYDSYPYHFPAVQYNAILYYMTHSAVFSATVCGTFRALSGTVCTAAIFYTARRTLHSRGFVVQYTHA